MKKTDLLVIISCGAEKIWRRNPDLGPTQARIAYVSPVFKASRRYADAFADRWIVLSAKYGFVEPDFPIPQDYDVTWGDEGQVSDHTLSQQIEHLSLSGYRQIAVLASYEYWFKVVVAFRERNVTLRHVNAGIGFPPSLIKLINELIESGNPFPNPT